MASSTAPDAPAAKAVDREAEGAGALSGPEEDIDDDVLANLLSASWPTPAVVDDKYGLWGNPPDRGDRTPGHEPETGGERSRNTPLGG